MGQVPKGTEMRNIAKQDPESCTIYRTNVLYIGRCAIRCIWSITQGTLKKAAGALPGSARQALAQHGVEKTNNGGVL